MKLSNQFVKFSKSFASVFNKRLAAFKSNLLANPTISALVFLVVTWLVAAGLQVGFEKNAEGHNINNLEEGIWWGIVTFLTVGYGDKFPVSLPGRITAAVLMIAGVVSIAIVTAKISSFFLERALRERRGFVDSSRLKDHFVICGWKDEMSNLLLHIIDSNKSIKDSEIVLLNNVADGKIEEIRAIAKLKGVKVIKGDFFVEVNLKRVAPERATKILILADATPNEMGKIPTITEADARTIMTAMTLNNIARGVAVTAEILDPAMDQYLRLAHVNEIVYSREYSRMLLAMASTGTGVTNIFHDLMSSDSPHFITTIELDEAYFFKSFGELRSLYVKEHPDKTLLGILENSGNSHIAKEKALRRAQLTANVGELVKNLQTVKALRFNQPIFNPDSSYVVREGSMAIVIENRGEVRDRI